MSSEHADTLDPGVAAAGNGSRSDPVDDAIRSFQSGTDREASFRVIYRSYYRRLQRFFAAKGLASEDCQDLTQETLLRVFKGLDAYQHRMRFASWLYRLATNVYRKRLRSAGAVKRSAREVPLAALPDPGAAKAEPADQLLGMIDDEKREAMRRAVRELPEQMRKCLTLRLDHDLSYHEIAVVMRIKIDTVKAHLFQARRRLREELREFLSGDLDL